MSKPRKTWSMMTDEDKKIAVEFYQKDMTMDAIVKETGYVKDAIFAAVKDSGIETRRGKAKLMRPEIERRLIAGEKLIDVCRDTGVPKSTIEHWKRKLGLSKKISDPVKKKSEEDMTEILLKAKREGKQMEPIYRELGISWAKGKRLLNSVTARDNIMKLNKMMPVTSAGALPFYA